MDAVKFAFSLVLEAGQAAFSDLGTTGLGWIVGLGTPFLVVLMKMRSSAPGNRVSFVGSQWKTGLRDIAIVVVGIWLVIALWEGAWNIPRRIWKQTDAVQLPSCLWCDPPKVPVIEPPKKSTQKSGGSSPLEIVDFDSTKSLILMNNSDRPIFAISFVASIQSTIPKGNESISYPLDSEVEPHKPQTYHLNFEGAFETIQPTKKKWDDQWSSSYKAYAQGCIRVAFYAPSNMILRQQVEHFKAAGILWPIGDTIGVITYKDPTTQAVQESRVHLSTILLKRQGCQLKQ
jgi:hypothetical protein